MFDTKRKLLLFFLTFLIILDFLVWYQIFNNGKLRVAFLDVGQGDSILVTSPSGNIMLIDGGPDRSVLEGLGREMGFLNKVIDFLMVSNPDKDHIAGFISVLEKYKVLNVIIPGTVSSTETYQAFLDAVSNEGSNIFIARRGERIDFGDGVFMDILFPDRDVSSLDTNTGSIVGKLVYGETDILFTGDVTGEVEEYLSIFDKDVLESEVLKVAHHGSKTSSNESFLEVVAPQYAVISLGKSNKYGHPHQEVLNNLSLVGAKILRTDEIGTVRLVSDGKALFVK